MNEAAHILVVDDNPEVLEVFSETLRAAGYEVDEALTGQRALQMARERRPDLVLLDVVLPDLSGMEVCRQIKTDAGLPDVSVVLISGQATDATYKVRGLETGADDYLLKPVERNELLARVRAMLRLRDTTTALRASEQRYRQLVEMLRASEERLRAFLENSAVIAWMKDAEGRYVFVSNNFQKRFQVRFEDWEGKTDSDLGPRDVAEEFRRNDVAVLASGHPSEVIERTANPDGRPSWWLANRFLFRDAAGKRYVGGLGVDITERKRTAEALRDSEERFGAVFASAPLGIAIYGSDGQYLQANRAYCDMLGRTESELLSLGPMEVTHPEDVAEGERLLADVFAGRRAGYAREKRFLRKDERVVTAHMSVAGVRSSAGRVTLVVSMALDVTESRRIEREIHQISAHERRRFSYDLHDGLGQYLTGLAMKAKCLEEALRGTAPEHAASASELCQWLSQASAQARAIGRGLDPVQVELGGLVPALHKLTQDSEALFSFRCEFHCDVPEVQIAPEISVHLYRIAQEVINNAAKHAQAQRVQVKLTVDRQGLYLSIQDDGVGFRAGIAEGDGMGLRTVRFRADTIGASLTCESQPGHGVKVACRLPASRLALNNHKAT